MELKTRKIFYPLSILYGWVIACRNYLFDNGILKSHSFDLPVISVGNITVGGTGKTPHIEYLVNLLKGEFRVAVLSRGYKRLSKGFILADLNTSMHKIGDEPFQMRQKYPDILVAVDKDRCHGIDKLRELDPKPDAILLDDAYQHRYVKPGINILLVDYNRLICNDMMLPAGNLREPERGKNRANIVLITKCPQDIKPFDYRIISKHMKLYPYQKLFFTTFQYKGIKALFKPKEEIHPMKWLRDKKVLLLTGIASPDKLQEEIRRYTQITPLTYGDHHAFTPKDMELLRQKFQALKSKEKLIVTTEKDAARLQDIDFIPEELKPHLYVVPIEVVFMQDQQKQFNHIITDYVRKNTRNSFLP